MVYQSPQWWHQRAEERLGDRPSKVQPRAVIGQRWMRPPRAPVECQWFTAVCGGSALLQILALYNWELEGGKQIPPQIYQYINPFTMNSNKSTQITKKSSQIVLKAQTKFRQQLFFSTPTIILY